MSFRPFQNTGNRRKRGEVTGACAGELKILEDFCIEDYLEYYPRVK
jgi:hypothetical protein